MQIDYKHSCALSGTVDRYSVSLPIGQDSGCFGPVVCVADNDSYQLTEEEVERLSRLATSISVTFCADWENQSGSTDGWSTYLSIKFGYSTLAFNWFCDCPEQWVGVGELANAVRQIAESHKTSTSGCTMDMVKQCINENGKLDMKKLDWMSGIRKDF